MDFNRLDAILKKRGISRRKLAIATGIKESTMSTAFMRRSGLNIYDVLNFPVLSSTATRQLSSLLKNIRSIY